MTDQTTAARLAAIAERYKIARNAYDFAAFEMNDDIDWLLAQVAALQTQAARYTPVVEASAALRLTETDVFTVVEQTRVKRKLWRAAVDALLLGKESPNAT